MKPLIRAIPESIKTESKAVAVATDRNPYTEFANAVSPKNIYGTLLKFSKGDWVAGESNALINIGTPMICVMDKMSCGWIRWQDSRPADQVMVEVAGGAKPPRRTELGDTDKNLWELDDKGQAKDPWQFTIYLPMIEHGDHEVYTFTTSSKGGISAVGAVSGTYGLHVTQHPDQYPVVHLSVDRYNHKNKQFGVIKTPKLEPAGYVEKNKLADVLIVHGLVSDVSNFAAAAYNEANPPPNDEIPF